MGDWDFYAAQMTKYAKRGRRAYDKGNYSLAWEYVHQAEEALKKCPFGELTLLKWEIERNNPPQPYPI